MAGESWAMSEQWKSPGSEVEQGSWEGILPQLLNTKAELTHCWISSNYLKAPEASWFVWLANQLFLSWSNERTSHLGKRSQDILSFIPLKLYSALALITLRWRRYHLLSYIFETIGSDLLVETPERHLGVIVNCTYWPKVMLGPKKANIILGTITENTFREKNNGIWIQAEADYFSLSFLLPFFVWVFFYNMTNVEVLYITAHV